jgi:hypothetical protein
MEFPGTGNKSVDPHFFSHAGCVSAGRDGTGNKQVFPVSRLANEMAAEPLSHPQPAYSTPGSTSCHCGNQIYFQTFFKYYFTVEKEFTMARKTTARPASRSNNRTARQRSPHRPSTPIYGDILGIVGSLMRHRQESGAAKIGSMANAARNFAADLTDIPNVKTYVHAAANQMESLSDYVSDSSLEQMMEDATAFAKRYPMATAAFAVAAGFGFTRLMTHGNADHRSTSPNTGKRATARSSTRTKATSTRGRSNKTVKANGKDTSHDRANAS